MADALLNEPWPESPEPRMRTADVGISSFEWTGLSTGLTPEKETQELDMRSFLLGQRHALDYAFREALPRQQQLGALRTAVTEFRELLQRNSLSVREVELAQEAARTLAAAVESRLAELEQRRIIQVEASVAEVRGQLASLQSGVNALAALRAASPKPAGLTGPAGWVAYLVGRTASWFDSSASDALSLGLSLARRVLFDAPAGADSGSADALEPTQGIGAVRHSSGSVLALGVGPGGRPAAAAAGAGGVPGHDGFAGEQRKVAAQLRGFVGAGMTLLLVEVAFRGIFRNVRGASKRRQKMLRIGPLVRSFHLARNILWLAAVVIIFSEVKAGCFAMAGAVTDACDSIGGAVGGLRRTRSEGGSGDALPLTIGGPSGSDGPTALGGGGTQEEERQLSIVPPGNNGDDSGGDGDYEVAAEKSPAGAAVGSGGGSGSVSAAAA